MTLLRQFGFSVITLICLISATISHLLVLILIFIFCLILASLKTIVLLEMRQRLNLSLEAILLKALLETL
jgi:hypothetical protein